MKRTPKSIDGDGREKTGGLPYLVIDGMYQDGWHIAPDPYEPKAECEDVPPPRFASAEATTTECVSAGTRMRVINTQKSEERLHDEAVRVQRRHYVAAHVPDPEVYAAPARKYAWQTIWHGDDGYQAVSQGVGRTRPTSGERIRYDCRWLTQKEVARRHSVSERTVRTAAKGVRKASPLVRRLFPQAGALIVEMIESGELVNVAWYISPSHFRVLSGKKRQFSTRVEGLTWPCFKCSRETHDTRSDASPAPVLCPDCRKPRRYAKRVYGVKKPAWLAAYVPGQWSPKRLHTEYIGPEPPPDKTIPVQVSPHKLNRIKTWISDQETSRRNAITRDTLRGEENDRNEDQISSTRRGRVRTS